MYAELIGNCKNQRIKSFQGNNLKKSPKDYEQLTKEYFEAIKEKGLSKNLCNYVWNVLVATSRGYGFNKSHTLAYSLIGLQEMNLAYKYPVIYWNTACLITDSGSGDGGTDYTKIAQSVNKIMSEGIKVSLVDVNKSNKDFTPDKENNQILFGLKAVSNIGDALVDDIIANRPYTSILDFIYKINPNRTQMLMLIKGGAFDSFMPRYDAMITYLWITCDKKKRLTLQNLPGLIKYNLIPSGEEFISSRRVFEFNRYLKNICKFNTDYYRLDERALRFLIETEKENLIKSNNQNGQYFMSVREWDKGVYQPTMDIFRTWINEDKEHLLDELNTKIFMEDWNKYAQGNLSSWEMEALCFYYHEHELAHVNMKKYGLSNFNEFAEVPPVEKFFKRNGASIPIYKLFTICGTCIAKDKTKSTVYVLTTEGQVVPVKFRQEYFSLFDRQTFKKNPDGTKTVIERSWFNRGNMIMVQGIRRGDEFVAKKYASSSKHQLYHIDSIEKNGELELRSERKQGDEEVDEV